MLPQIFATTNLRDLMSSANMVDFFNHMEWLNWVIYVALVLVLTSILSPIFARVMNERSARLTSLLVSFMGITGFVWVLLSNDMLPTYLVLFAGELLVLVLVGLFIFTMWTTNREGGNLGQFMKWGSIIIGLTALSLYHGMIKETLKYTMSAGSWEDTFLYQIADTLPPFEISGTIAILLIAIVAVFAILGEVEGNTRLGRRGANRIGNWNRQRRERNRQVRQLVMQRDQAIDSIMRTYQDILAELRR